MCGLVKPLADFAHRNTAAGTRQSHCRSCHAAYRRAHYVRNRDAYVRREVTRMNGYRRENRRRLLGYLVSHPCVDCGEADPVVLEFDHRDPTTKRAEVGRLAAGKRWDQVRAEIEKCDVRCANCHRARTAGQFHWRKRVVHAPEVHTEVHTEIHERRRCTACGETKAVGDFAYRDRSRDARRSWCRRCVSRYGRAHYLAHRERYAQGSWGHRGDRRGMRDAVADHLRAHPCVDCGERDLVMLDFDHRDRTTKVATVAWLLAHGQRSETLAEIAKCEVRCANCHRRRTARQFRWHKLRGTAA